MFKAVQYAYPSSDLAKLLGYEKTGCFYITSDKNDPLSEDAHIHYGATTKKELIKMYNACPVKGDFYNYCGKIMDFDFYIESIKRGGVL